MKMSLHQLDAEIDEIQARIAAERLALEDAINGCTNSLRDAVASPKTLLAVLGVGFGVGKLMFGKKAAPKEQPAPKKAGVLGMLGGVAGTALTLLKPTLGVGSIARWAASKAFSRGDKKAPASADAVKARRRVSPPVRTVVNKE